MQYCMQYNTAAARLPVLLAAINLMGHATMCSLHYFAI